MGDVVDALTSDRGLFAAVTAVAGLAAVVVGLVRPVLKSRRDAAAAVPILRFATVRVEPPPPHSEAGMASFELVNVRGGTAVLRDLLLEIRDHGSVDRPRMTVPAAPVPRFTYKVVLEPAVATYDVRKKEFGSSPPHRYDSREVEAFRIELLSVEPQWYEFEFVVHWYDASRPTEVHELTSPRLRIDFLPDITQVLPG